MNRFIKILAAAGILLFGAAGVANAQVTVSVGGGGTSFYVGPDYDYYVPGYPVTVAPSVVTPVVVAPVDYPYYYHHHHYYHRPPPRLHHRPPLHPRPHFGAPARRMPHRGGMREPYFGPNPHGRH